MKRKAKDILIDNPTTVLSLRLPIKMVKFLDQEVKNAKSKTGTRNQLIEGILEDWCVENGYKK